MRNKPVVLFLCTHNAGRSLAARVLLEHRAGGRIDVRSAGSEPADQLNPSVVAVLRERGLDVVHDRPKRLTDEDGQAADVIVTMGCGDTCGVYPGKRYLDWDLPDPAGLDVDAVRPIVDEIDRRVEGLLAELTGGSAARRLGGSAARRLRRLEVWSLTGLWSILTLYHRLLTTTRSSTTLSLAKDRGQNRAKIGAGSGQDRPWDRPPLRRRRAARR